MLLGEALVGTERRVAIEVDRKLVSECASRLPQPAGYVEQRTDARYAGSIHCTSAAVGRGLLHPRLKSSHGFIPLPCAIPE